MSTVAVSATNLPLASPLLNLIHGLHEDVDALPSLAFGRNERRRNKSSPNLGTEQDQLEPDDQFCDKQSVFKAVSYRMARVSEAHTDVCNEVQDCPITN